jgi:NAD(P)-dependent dehydrogenase (short-subunit alcohol dehydrogenase family)
MELGRHGITVNCYAPGPIQTEMRAHSGVFVVPTMFELTFSADHERTKGSMDNRTRT